MSTNRTKLLRLLLLKSFLETKSYVNYFVVDNARAVNRSASFSRHAIVMTDENDVISSFIVFLEIMWPLSFVQTYCKHGAVCREYSPRDRHDKGRRLRRGSGTSLSRTIVPALCQAGRLNLDRIPSIPSPICPACLCPPKTFPRAARHNAAPVWAAHILQIGPRHHKTRPQQSQLF